MNREYVVNQINTDADDDEVLNTNRLETDIKFLDEKNKGQIKDIEVKNNADKEL